MKKKGGVAQRTLPGIKGEKQSHDQLSPQTSRKWETHITRHSAQDMLATSTHADTRDLGHHSHTQGDESSSNIKVRIS